MYMVLFHVATGEIVKWYDSEAGARTGMRVSNKNAGWERKSRSWTAGAEFEWCHSLHDDKWDYGPYAIASHETWQKNFNPSAVLTRRKLADAGEHHV